MSRRNSALLALGLLALAGALVATLSLSQATAVQAALPENHPTLDALYPSTQRDFLLPGTQPNQLQDPMKPVADCTTCHAGYSGRTQQPQSTETWMTWAGSMMAQAGRDPLFFAALDVANAGAADSGEFCLRCHMPSGWLEGRSGATDGSAMTANDQEGVQCSVCHRLVDPVSDPANPARDAEILAALEDPVTVIGSGGMIVDPGDFRRGPFDIVADLGIDPHRFAGGRATQLSPYHRESILCGTCHDISNPLFTWNPTTQIYEPNAVDEPGDAAQGFPIERTFSEWRLSAFNTPEGVYLPQFGGNREHVSTCQDCHMSTVTGAGGAFGDTYIIRDNMPLHDLTGANAWVPQTLPLHLEFGQIFQSDPTRAQALEDGIERARAMLQKAAALDVNRQGDALEVTITNLSGHKLPTGYIEGRRMWLQVEGYNAEGALIYSSGAYDVDTATLDGYGSDPTLRVYEAKHGLTETWAAQLGLEPGASFHFVLNNQIVSDNRIPPMGYEFAAFDAAQAAPYTDSAPDPTRYADGQFWDTAVYTLPPGVTHGVVRLLHQTATREYIEFLRENNPNPGENNGEILYDLWEQTERSKPEVMAERTFAQQTGRLYLPAVQIP